MKLRPVLAAIAGTAAAVVLAGPALAHVEPSVSEAAAGSQTTVEFTVQHGCDGSPTNTVEFQVPEGVDDPSPVAKDGWTASVDGRVVTFSGGSLPDDVEDTFAISFTVPDTPGETLYFPFIQTCDEGSIDWIQTEADADRPAPALLVGEADPNATTTSSAPDADQTTTTVANEAPSSTEPAVIPPGEAVLDGGETVVNEEDNGTRPFVIGGIVVVIAVIGVAVAANLKRRDQA